MRVVSVAAAIVCCALLVGGAAGSTARARATVFTGYGFDTCAAPSLQALTAWQVSPYRALGIYIGGANRACSDGNLNSFWVAAVEGMGWNLLPLYVGLQAPCVSQQKLARISSNLDTAAAQGAAAADDAVARAATFGLPNGSPIYFDMEGYATNNASCTSIVQAFLAGWDNELRARAYISGVYGSAASTVRDMALLGADGPDQAWIANWNGNPSVFGDPYVSDALWPNHQRIHQYKGGHKETFGGVTINIDNDFVDAAVVSAGTSLPSPPPPTPSGSVGSGDGKASAAWTSDAFETAVVVTLTPVTPPPGGYALRLSVADASTTAPVTSFGAPATIHVLPQGSATIPVGSQDGTTWTPLPQLSSAALPAGTQAGYVRGSDGSFDILTLAPGFFGLVPDTTPPSRPVVSGRVARAGLTVVWSAATDAGSGVAGYEVLRDGTPLLRLPGSALRATARGFHPDRQTVYRVRALDAAGNASTLSRAVVVVPTARPKSLPRPLPRWAWSLFRWQRTHVGRRPPTAPRTLPAWYRRWAAWRLEPFHLRN